MRLLADENFPRSAVGALRAAGYDVAWVRSDAPGIADAEVLARAMREHRILLTFDKDFGELAWRSGLAAECGIMLFRVPMPPPVDGAAWFARLVASRSDWAGHFSVIEVDRVRMRAVPAQPPGATNGARGRQNADGDRVRSSDDEA